MSFSLRGYEMAGGLDDNAYSVFGIGVPARSGVWRAWVKQRERGYTTVLCFMYLSED